MCVTRTGSLYESQQKAEIVRRHLKDKIPISSLAEEFAIQPTQIYQWVALILERAEQGFENNAKPNVHSRRAAQSVAVLKD
ncbi:MAG TPA: transposase [Pirellulaceae bacterium]|nr:transposase [Pirellulaceae bacterium]